MHLVFKCILKYFATRGIYYMICIGQVLAKTLAFKCPIFESKNLRIDPLHGKGQSPLSFNFLFKSG